jgi:hypothetical protein
LHSGGGDILYGWTFIGNSSLKGLVVVDVSGSLVVDTGWLNEGIVDLGEELLESGALVSAFIIGKAMGWGLLLLLLVGVGRVDGGRVDGERGWGIGAVVWTLNGLPVEVRFGADGVNKPEFVAAIHAMSFQFCFIGARG